MISSNQSTQTETQTTSITLAHGDGIGPEIMGATLRILEAANVKLDYKTIEIGEQVFERGQTSGIDPESWDTLRETKVFLKAPITTPTGKGYKSLNVTTRKTLGLYANVRRCVSYHPFVQTKHPKMDVVIIRENEEDTYAGIEHQQTGEVTQCLKLITRPGCEKIVRYAFEYAKANNRKKVTCFVKDNIMKLTDGLLYEVFQEIAAEYPEIESDRMIIDIGAAMLADQPELFDVIVTGNLYGDIISDIAAQVSGSVGLCGSANIGESCAMFEAIHGSAPPLAGRNCANPSGLLLSAVMMLNHLGQHEAATKIHNAWLTTIEEGIHTFDIHNNEEDGHSVGSPAETDKFADAVIARLGQQPVKLEAVNYGLDSDVQLSDTTRASEGGAVVSSETAAKQTTTTSHKTKELVGVDVFLDWCGDLAPADRDPNQLGNQLSEIADAVGCKLKMITNRGVKVYPNGFPETFCTDHWRCRFIPKDGDHLNPGEVIGLLAALLEADLDFIKTEHLYTFDGKLGYSLGQGE